MPRPRKQRKVCSLPRCNEFHPNRKEILSDEKIVLTVDEYETIRLIDKEGFSQEECSEYMKIARTTVQSIYNNARKKLATALVEGLSFRIEGGEYHLCDGKESYCGCGGCRKHSCRVEQVEKGDGDMILAIPVDEDQKNVCITLGRAPYIAFYHVETKEMEILLNPGAVAEGGAGLICGQFLLDNKADVLITVRCGENIAEVLKEAEVKIYKSVEKEAMKDITAFLEGKLEELTKFHGGFHGIQ